MYFFLLLFPFLAFFINFFLGRFLGREFTIKFCLIFSFLCFLVSLFLCYETLFCFSLINIKLYKWAVINGLCIEFGLIFDKIGCIMLLVVSSISFFVQLFSLDYMSKDPFLIKFMTFLSLFTFFMLILVTSDNFIQLFIG
jgi:NADH-quinone oxidoreductase subunit L